MHFYDFFSGCGGTSAGMRAAGMSVRMGVDVDPDAAQTFAANFTKANFICQDIRDLRTEALAPHIRSSIGSPMLFGACAPCQPFSTQNRQKQKNDKRRSLLFEFHRFVEAYRPEYIFIENVPGLQNVNRQKSPLAEFINFLQSADYHFDFGVVMACKYGVPQTRRRFVLMASRLGPISIPLPTHGPETDNPKFSTVRQWLKGLPKLKAGQIDASDSVHRAASLSELNLKRIALTPAGGGRVDWPEELWLDCHKTHDGHTDVYGRMHWDRPATALTTRCISLSNGRFGHPKENRAISVREAACLQTFPRDFVFHGTMSSMARQVGNAVLAKMAEIFGRAFIEHYAKMRRRVSA